MKVVILCALLAVGSFGLDQFVKKQTDVLDILDRINDKSFIDHVSNTARHYYPGDYPDNYHDFHKVTEWIDGFHQNHWRKRDVHFNLFHPHHREQAIEMFHVFMLAKDYDAFFKTACWAREHANQGIFIYSFIVAILNREDTHGVQLPPMYEINPHYFASIEVIQEAYSAKMKQISKTIDMHFTGTRMNPEQWVAYFGEDIGLNNHHFHWHADFPFWWNSDSQHEKDRKGELFFYVHHMLTARFDQERLSNYLPPVKPLHWDKPIEEGFLPHAMYKYEGEFPFRPDHMNFHDLHFISLHEVKNMEQRILEAIDLGYIIDKHGEHIYINDTDGIDHLGKIMESSMDSLNPAYYGSLHNVAHVVLSRVSDPEFKYGTPPGVMEHFETATRDPAFFRLHKYIDNIFKKHKDSLPPYTKEELHYPGVTVDSVEITGASPNNNEFITFFDDFEFDLTNALDNSANVEEVDIKARVKRLNHEKFSIKIDFTSEHEGVGTFRIFLAPAIDSFYHTEIDINEKRWMMFELDRFAEPIKVGKNHIIRKSTESSATIPDRKGFKEMRQKLADGTLQYEEHKRHCGLPHRLLLPKGTENGMPFKLFVMITDFEKDKTHDISHDHNVGDSLSYCGTLHQKYPDSKPMGFPFDRHIEDVDDFHQGNMFVQDVVIKHHK